MRNEELGMRNNKKFFKKQNDAFILKYKLNFHSLLFIIISLFFVFSCSDPFTPAEPEINLPVDSVQNGVKITLSSEIGTDRTLLPSNAVFSRYMLSFRSHEWQNEPPPVDISPDQNTVVIPLTDGLWTISAAGFVSINGTEYQVAEGNEQINVIYGTDQSLNIHLSVMQQGAEGVFSYSVSFPQDKGIYDASLRINPFNDMYYETVFINLLEEEEREGRITLNPGYYLMRISLSNGYQISSKTEIIHIYPGMTTSGTFNFDNGGFTDTFTVSGALNVTINGEKNFDSVLIRAYHDADYSIAANEKWFNYSYEDDIYVWSMQLAVFDTDTVLYFSVGIYVGNVWIWNDSVRNVTVKDQDRYGINLGTVDFNTITLSGTINATVNNGSFSYMYIYAYTENGNEICSIYRSYDMGSSWSMSIAPFDNPTNVYFSATVYSNNGLSYRRQNIAGLTGVYNQNRSGVTLNIGNIREITISGTVDITIDGEASSFRKYVEVYRDENCTDYVFNIYVNSDGTWSRIQEAFDASTVLYFSVNVYNSHSGYWREKRTGISRTIFNTDVSDINLGLFNLNSSVTLGGTVNITYEDELWYNQISIYIYSDENYKNQIGSAYAYSGGYWSVNTSYFTDAPLFFRLETGGYKKQLGNIITLQDENIYNINLDAAFRVIALNGTVDVRINEQIQRNNITVSAFLDENYTNEIYSTYTGWDGSWQMQFTSFEEETDVYFRIGSYVVDSWVYKAAGSITVLDEDISDIDLGTMEFNSVTLSGTVDVKVNGEMPESQIRIMLYYDAGFSNYFRDIYADSDGTWSVELKPFNANTSLYFIVGTWFGGQWFERRLDVSRTVYNENISNINLGTIDFSVSKFTLSGSVNITVNGEAANIGEVRMYNHNFTHYSGYTHNINNDDKTWTFTTVALDAPTTYYFAVIYNNPFTDSWHLYRTGAARTVLNQDITGINLNGSIDYIWPPAASVSLTEDEWMNGDIPGYPDTERWYTISVTEGTTYYLWWNDNNNGNGIKTLNAVVGAWDGSGNRIFGNSNYRYDYSEQFTASSTGTVYIGVFPSWSDYTGTFGLVYSAKSSIYNMPAANDFNISGLGKFIYEGRSRAAAITPRDERITGNIIVYYNGSTVPPKYPGTYDVTFTVEAADNYKAAYGLYAGIITIVSGQ